MKLWVYICVAFVLYFPRNGFFFKVKSSPMSVSQSEGTTHAGLYRWQQTWAAGISYRAGKKGTEPAKSWDAHAWRCCERPLWQVKKSTKKPRRAANKSGDCSRNGPFSEALKAVLSQSLASLQYRAWAGAKQGFNLLLPNCLLSLFAKTY